MINNKESRKPVRTAAMGLVALAVPIFLHSVYHAIGGSIPLLSYFPFSLSFGIILLIVGIVEFIKRNEFMSVLYLIYAGFWLGEVVFAIMLVTNGWTIHEVSIDEGLMWTTLFLLNTFILVWGMREQVKWRLLTIILGLEVMIATFIVGHIGGEGAGQAVSLSSIAAVNAFTGAGTGLTAISGYAGMITSIIALVVVVMGDWHPGNCAVDSTTSVQTPR